MHTGQHYDAAMSDVFFEELNIPKPDYSLDVGSKSHGAQTGEMLSEIEDVILHEHPDCVLVYGDTNSTLAGALAASKLHIPIAHVEAGLRSFNRRMPEEINRVLTDHVSKWLFCPTQTAITNLGKEGITKGVELVGDVMLDAVNYNSALAAKKSRILEELSLEAGGYVLITIHRAENTDDPERFGSIVTALNNLQVPAVLPMHPRSRATMKSLGLTITNPKINVVNPVGYLDMLQLEQHAAKIVTDSGGVQKEAFFFKVPCITLRDETEWVETVDLDANVLVGANTEQILHQIDNFKVNFDLLPEPFGDGNAAEKIADILLNTV